MFNQHAKWLDAARAIPWRQPISSLNYLLTSHVWHQDHNGFSHQDPGFIDVALNKKADIVRVYLPPDANTLLCVTDHVLRTWDRINIIVAGKPPLCQWLSMEQAVVHCRAGIGIWDWASDPAGGGSHILLPRFCPQNDEAANDEGAGHHHRGEQVGLDGLAKQQAQQIGRASCRERV